MATVQREDRTLPVPVAFPDVRRPEATAVFVGDWHAPDRAAALRHLEDVTAGRDAGAWPEGVLSVSGFLSDEGTRAVTYVQGTSAEACRPFVSGTAGAAPQPVEYRLRDSVLPDGPAQVPGCVVFASFTTDGAERQRLLVEEVAGTLAVSGPGIDDGMLSAHLHASADGTRVLNYAEWTTAAAHETFLHDGGSAQCGALFDALPGVRRTGYVRCELVRTGARP